MDNILDSSYVAIGVGVVLVLLVVVAGFISRRSRKLDSAYYNKKWQDLQKLLKDKATWPLAIIDADKLWESGLLPPSEK